MIRRYRHVMAAAASVGLTAASFALTAASFGPGLQITTQRRAGALSAKLTEW